MNSLNTALEYHKAGRGAIPFRRRVDLMQAPYGNPVTGYGSSIWR